MTLIRLRGAGACDARGCGAARTSPHPGLTAPDTSRNDVRPLVVTFAINGFWRRVDPTGRIIADDHFNSWPEISHRQCFSWMQMLGHVEIFYWYDLEWEMISLRGRAYVGIATWDDANFEFGHLSRRRRGGAYRSDLLRCGLASRLSCPVQDRWRVIPDRPLEYLFYGD